MRDNDIQYNILKYCPESFKLLKEYSYITKKTKNNPEFDYLFDCDNLGLI